MMSPIIASIEARTIGTFEVFMRSIEMCFDILGRNGFQDIGRITTDNVSILAAGAVPDDLPGDLGARVRSRLERGEITPQQASYTRTERSPSMPHHTEQVRCNLQHQAKLCRKFAAITGDDDLAAEWNETAAEMDALIQAIGRPTQADAPQRAA
jgi:hypothetical protein